MMIRYMVSDLLLRDLFNDWVTLVEQDLEDGNADTNRLYNRAKVYFKTTSAFGDVK